MKLTDNFYLEEFIPETVYTQFGEKSIMFLDPRLPLLVQNIRNMAGVPISVNNWKNGGNRIESGYRIPRTSTGAEYSMHKRGAAADLHPEGMTIEELFEKVKYNFEFLNKLGLTTCEDISSTKSWLHIDTRWILGKQTSLNIVKP